MTPCHPAARVADYTARGWWTPDTMDGLFSTRVAEQPDAPAVVDPANKAALLGTAARRLTWGELADEVTRFGTGLLRAGFAPGDALGVQVPNTVELVALYLAAWRLGVVVCPFPVQFREHELTAMCPIAGVRTLVTVPRIGDREYARPLAAALPAVEVRLVDALRADPDADLVAGHVAAHPVDPNDRITLCWTSGTEGTPKAVPRCAYDWLAIGRGTTGGAAVTAADVLLNPFPMVNMAGISGVFLPWLITGAVLVQHHPFDLPTFLHQLGTERITYTVAPPALLTTLLARDDLLSTVDLSALRAIGSGAAPLSPAMVRGWQDRHGVGVINFFGSNEGTALVTAPADVPDPERRARYYPRYGVPGFRWTSPVAEQTSVRLVDPASGAEITEPGVPGELRIAGPTVFAGYLDGTTDPFDEHGHLRTGDVFEIAGESGEFLHYLDRAKDLVIRGGNNIVPAELENLLATHPRITEAAVVGYPDEVLGERVCAVLVSADGAPVELPEVLTHLRSAGVASYKLPERALTVPELPRNPLGKVAKRELRALL